MFAEKTKLHKRLKAYKDGSLRTIALDVTSKCNMNCSHCYAETYKNVEPVKLDVLKIALDEAYQLGVFHYVLQGGEPIIDPSRLESIIQMCYPEETYINVVTNGWEMTLEKIKWLKSLMVDKITFSLDSGIEDEHDSKRGNGSYKRVIEAVDNVLNEGLLSSISIVVTHDSLHSDGFKKAYLFAQEKQIRVDVQIAEPVGKWDGKKELLMTLEDSKFIKELQQNAPILPNGQILVNRDIFCGEKDHCPAGTEFMSISANGDLLPCNFLQFYLGNVQDKKIEEMRSDLLKNKWFDNSHPNCLCGENDEFIDKFIVPYVHLEKPLDAYEIFSLREKNER